MTEWNFTDYKGTPLPKPVNWDTAPELFDPVNGNAVRIRGPRFIDNSGKSWVWGPTEWVRDLEQYTVLCFLQDKSRFHLSDQTNHGVRAYAMWVDGQAVDMVWDTLDGALVDMVRFKHEGWRGSSGPRATEYFLKMVGTDGGES